MALPHDQPSTLRQAPERSIRRGLGGFGRSRRADLGNDPTSVGDEHDLAILDVPQVVAEAGLELADSNGLHGLKVVSCDYISKGPRFSEKHDTSISRLVSEFLRSLGGPDVPDTPIVSRLVGILPPETRPEDYHRHLVEKYES